METFEEAKELAEYAREGVTPMPAHLFYAVPSARQHMGVLPYFLQLTRFPSAVIVDRNAELEAFFGAWRELCTNGHRADRAHVTRMKKQVPPVLQQFAPDVELAFELIQQTCSIVRTAICIETAHGDYVPNSSQRRWWRHAPPQLGGVQKQIQGLRALAGTSSIFDPVMAHMNDWLSALRQLDNSNAELSLLAAASCCMAIGNMQRDAGERLLALHFWFRSLDFFLQSMCFSAGLFVETGLGFSFRHSSTTLVGPKSCYSELHRAQIILHDQKIDGCIDRCNTVRNQLLTVHSVFGVSQPQETQYRDDVHEAMRGLNSAKSTAVFKTANSLSRRVAIDSAGLFAFDTDAASALVEWGSAA